MGCIGFGLKVKHSITENPYIIVNFEKDKISRLNYQEKINSTLELMYKSSHRYMFRLLNNFETEDRIGLIFEPYEGESLDILIQQGKCDLNTSLKYFVEIVYAIKHANSFGLYNVNIRPENILVDECVKITDFGLKMTGKTDIPKRAKQIINMGNKNITIDGYFSPEEINNILNKKDYTINSKIDSWNLGVLLFEMLTNFKSPFIIKDNESLMESIINNELDLSLITDEFCKDLIKKLLVKIPEERIDIYEILNIDLIKNINREPKDIKDFTDNIINPEEGEDTNSEEDDEDSIEDKDEIIKRLKSENLQLRNELSKEQSNKKITSQINIKHDLYKTITDEEEKKENDNQEILSDKEEETKEENKNIINNELKEDKDEEYILDGNSSSEDDENDLENENIYRKYEILKEKYAKKKKKITFMRKTINSLKEEKNNLIKKENKKEEEKNLNILNDLEKLNISNITNLSELSDIITKSIDVFKESENNLESLMTQLIKISSDEHKPAIEESKKFIDYKSKIFFELMKTLKENEKPETKIEQNKEKEEKKKYEIKNTEISELRKKYESSKKKQKELEEKNKALEESNRTIIEMSKSIEKAVIAINPNYKPLFK